MPVPSSKVALSQTPLAVSKNVFEDVKVKSEQKEPKKEAKTYNCQTCGVDCSNIRYHCTKIATVDICPICFNDGRFATSLHAGDFIRLQQSDEAAASWTEQETLLLLEGVEMYQEDWSKVAAHVGKPRDECLLKFLGLPIEEVFVGQPSDSAGPLAHHKTPFSAADSPVLSLAAFLASVVNPSVAKKAGSFF